MSGADLSDRLREEVGRLTVGPAADFVAARTARVKELKAAGDKELAGQLASCRRPTVPAWAADQLAHRHADELDALFDAADGVRTTQSAADPDRAAVREATTAFTAQVRRLRGLAADRLAEAGTAADAHLDEVEATLLAAATDDEVAADLRAGALVRPAPSPGFAALASLAPPGGGRRAAGSPSRSTAGADTADERTAADERSADGAARDGDDDAEAEAAQRAEEEAAARRRLEEERAAIRARRTELTSRRDDVAADLASAEAQVAAAEAAAQRARDALADLDDQLADLDRQEADLPQPTG